jgi:predicted ferric reductase
LQHLGLNALSLLTGITGLVLLVALVITAAFRDQLPYRYETWRIGHTLAAAAVASLILTHALVAGRYSHIEAIRWFWIVLATVALLALVYSFIIVPQAMRRHPYRLVSLTPHKPGQWLLVFEPVGFALPTFRAGQFVWVSFRSPFSRLEHPLNVPSAPAAANTVAFVVHERGDWSRQVGQFRIGATAFLNGPYG